MPKNKIEVKGLYGNLGDKEATRNPQGNHSMQFDDTKIKLGDKTFELKTDGWKALTDMLDTTSPTLMAKRLCAIAINNQAEA